MSLEGVHGVVLTGGRSTRFGRDKLVESIDGSMLVERPLRALREVLGSVGIVGDADPRLTSIADRILEDHHPGIGPIGGVASALRHGDCIVLAGDLVNMTASCVRRFEDAPRAPCVLGATREPTGEIRVQPCIGLWRVEALARLEDAIARGAFALHAACPYETIEIDASSARNVNTPADVQPDG